MEHEDTLIDGIVPCFDSFPYFESPGRIVHHYNDGTAFKCEDNIYEAERNVMFWKEQVKRDMETEKVISDGIHIIVPMASEEEYHYFGLVDEQGKMVMENLFCGYERAATCANEEFPDCNYTVKDMTREWYIDFAVRYFKDIRRLKPFFKKSGIIMDMTGVYYSRNPDSRGTYIPFQYRGKRYVYAETVSEEFVYKVDT